MSLKRSNAAGSRAWCKRALGAGVMVLLVGCSSTNPSSTTSLSVMLKDAPGDVQKAVVTISEVDLVGTGGVTVLSSTVVTTDLLTLASKTASLVSGYAVPSGTYTELRFKITGACLAAANSTGGTDIYATTGYDATPCGGTATGTLIAPSYAQSGLKVTLPADALVLTGSQKILVVDFNVSQSFGHQAGGSGNWVLNPVVTGADITATGTVHTTAQLGTGVTLPNIGASATTLGQFSAVLLDAAADTLGVVPLTLSTTAGVYAADFIYVAPGNYTVGLKKPAGITTITTTPAIPAPVAVTSGQMATVGLTVTAAN